MPNKMIMVREQQQQRQQSQSISQQQQQQQRQYQQQQPFLLLNQQPSIEQQQQQSRPTTTTILTSAHDLLQSSTSFPQVEIHPSINVQQLDTYLHSANNHYLTLILYNYLETPKLEQFLGFNIDMEGELCLVRKCVNNSVVNKDLQQSNLYNSQKQQDHSKNNNISNMQYQYYLLYTVNDIIPFNQQSQLPLHQQQNQRYSQYQNRTSQYLTNKSITLKPIITLLISLCDQVIVYELNKQKESFIQKVFVQSVNTCQKIKWQTKMNINRPNRLVFVRQCYGEKKVHMKKQQSNQQSSQFTSKKQQKLKTSTPTPLTAATSLQTLQYYSSLEEYSTYLNTQQKKYVQLCSQYPQRPDHPYVEELIQKKSCLKLISLKEILNIYNQFVKFISQNSKDNHMMEKRKGSKTYGVSVGEVFNTKINVDDDQSLLIMEKFHNLEEPWKVRYYIEKVYELESISNLHNAIEYEIFHPTITNDHSHEFIKKQLKKYLSSPCYSTTLIFQQQVLNNLQYIPPFLRFVSLSPQKKQKLLWKLNKLQKYHHQLQQECKLSPQLSENRLLYELKDEEILNWIAKYKQHWMQLSMNHMKTYFNKIVNEKDHKAIQQFKQQCYKMTQRLSKIDLKLYDPVREKMITEVIREINTFVDYHFEVLETRGLAGIKFLYHQIKYTLKHKQKVKNKLMLFVLMIVLALMQKNVIAGITIATMAIIVLAIRL